MDGIKTPHNSGKIYINKILPKLVFPAGLFIIVAALLVFAGWQFDINELKSVIPGRASMKANTAFAFLFSGIALTLISRQEKRIKQVIRLLGSLVAVIGLLTIYQFIFNADLGIDEILFKEVENAVKTVHPGRMAPNTALNFILAGMAFIMLTFKPSYTRYPVISCCISPLQ
ncbi:MAG: hypothetical protein WDZ47_08895 [Bacteroidales bacterium]